MRNVNVAVIGRRGNIGSRLVEKICKKNWNIGYILEVDGFYRNLQEKMRAPADIYKGIDIAFVAIPTLDDGLIEFRYLNSFLKRGVPVVLSSKGAMSNYFNELAKYQKKIGYSATVGGGTRMLRDLESRIALKRSITGIDAVINGTLNYFFDRASKKESLEEIARSARELKYAEPGANSPLEIINKEATKDIPMKSAILFNISNLSSVIIKAKDIIAHELTKDELDEIIATNKRYIVSISKKDRNDSIYGFSHKTNGWTISGGFRDISKPVYSRHSFGGVSNSMTICEGGNQYHTIPGSGAGAEPTTESMIKDAEELLA